MSYFKAILQDITTSTNNSTEVNLAAGATFTGSADETLGINGIQLFHAADQECTIYIDQSISDSFPAATTVTDSFSCLANSPCTRTYTSVAPYYRLRVTNDGSSATTSLAAYTGMTPIINPLPRSLSDDGRLNVETTIIGQQNTDRHVWVTGTNAVNTVEIVRLVGTNFDGTTKDPNFWTETVTGTGSVTQSGGEIEIATGTTANSTAQYDSVRRARFVVGSSLQWQGIVKFVTAGTADNVRRVGAYDTTDGFYFQLDGTTFSVGYRKDSVDTLVNSGSFNGNYGPNYVMDTAYHKFAIEWASKGVFFYIDGVLLHKDGQGHRSNYLSLPIRLENVNDNGSVTNVVLDILATAIVRYGQLDTSATSKRMSGTGTTVCKYGPGILKGIIVSAVVNTADINIYDGLTTGGTLIWASGNQGARTEPFNIDFYGTPFSTGLTVEIADASADVVAVYE